MRANHDLNSRGMSLPIVLITMVGIAIVGAGLATYLNSTLALSHTEATRDAAKLAALRVQALVNNDRTWSQIASLNGLCAANGGDCSGSCGGTAAPIRLYDQNGALVYDFASNPANGFDRSGRACSAFPSESCPLRPQIYWKPMPDGTPACNTRPQVSVMFDNANSNDKINYGNGVGAVQSVALAGMTLTFVRGVPPESVAEYCVQSGGFYDAGTAECTLKPGLTNASSVAFTNITCVAAGGAWSGTACIFDANACMAPMGAWSAGNCTLKLSAGSPAIAGAQCSAMGGTYDKVANKCAGTSSSSCSMPVGRFDFTQGVCYFNSAACAGGQGITSFSTAGAGNVTCSPLPPAFDATSPAMSRCPLGQALTGVYLIGGYRNCAPYPATYTGTCPAGMHVQNSTVSPFGTFCNYDHWMCGPADMPPNATIAHSDWAGTYFPPCKADACVAGYTVVAGACVTGTPPTLFTATSISSLMAIDPNCNFSNPSWSLACTMAIHQACVAAGGVGGIGPMEWNSVTNQVMYQCINAGGGASVGPTYAQLTAAAGSSCTAANALSDICATGAHRYCTGLGYASGFLVDSGGSFARVDCVGTSAGVVQNITMADLAAQQPACSGSVVADTACVGASERWCKANGYSGGFGPVEHSGPAATITCLN